jgi:hypothetical protein
MFKRIRNLWELASFVPSTEGERTILVKDKELEEKVEAEFFSEGTEEEYREFEREEQGIKGIFGIGK